MPSKPFARKIKPSYVPGIQADIQQELKLLEQWRMLVHINLVSIWQHGLLPGYPDYYMIDMDYGTSNLSDYIDTRYRSSNEPERGIADKEVWDIFRQLATGTQFLHENGIFSVYLKPENSNSHHIYSLKTSRSIREQGRTRHLEVNRLLLHIRDPAEQSPLLR